MNASTIEFEYNQALLQANKLEEIAHNMRTLSQSDIENTVANIRSGWQGDAATMFAEKGYQLSQKSVNVASDLEKAAQSIRRIAKKIRNAEMATLAIINSKRT